MSEATKVKHTPGPWETECQGKRGLEYWHVFKGDLYISDAGGKTLEEMEANARLIAAAPEMAEALRNALSWIAKGAEGHQNGAIGRRVFDNAEAALKRAGIDA